MSSPDPDPDARPARSRGRFGFPNGRRFAFTILDDPDDARLETVRPVYDRLRQLALLTTSAVWPLDPPELPAAADTLTRPAYLAFVRELAADGFEVGWHGATMVSSDRDRTIHGLQVMQRELGRTPRVYANHDRNAENLHWGAGRFHSWAVRSMARMFDRRPAQAFTGQDAASPCYWGDLSRAHIDYVRNLTFPGLDLTDFDPYMPYRLAATPDVSHWFSTCDAPDARTFLRLVTPQAIDVLEANGGFAIVSTHFGRGFVKSARLDPEVDAVLTYLASRPGWFVPVSTLLDHLRAVRGAPRLGRLALARLELRYAIMRLCRRRSPPRAPIAAVDRR